MLQSSFGALVAGVMQRREASKMNAVLKMKINP
jgi:hypothetical protein